MEPAPETAPTEHEVRRQLDRMLSSSVFAGATRLSPLLQYIIDETLAERLTGDGTKLTEHQIGFALFENYDPNKSDVRANGSALRIRIRAYYKESGADDLLLIEIPPGTYRAVFSYNPTSPADKDYRRGLLHVGGFIPSAREHASLGWFNAAIQADPNHALAHAAKAEAELREAMYRRTISPYNPLAAAEASALEALRLQPNLWRAHVVQGAVHCCRREWENAGKSFDAALQSAPNRTRGHSWYSGFLLATGNEREALRLARSRVDENPDDLSAQIALGLFLYVTRRFQEAEEFLIEIAASFPKSWLARIVQACVYLARDQELEALVSVEQAHTILDNQSDNPPLRDNVFPGLLNLCQLLGGAEGGKHVARESMKRAIGHDSTAVHEVRHAAGEVPGDYDGWDPGEFDTHIPYWTPLQLALGFMRLGDAESANQALTRAVSEGDPLTAWLHLLPLFDPLRGDPAFQALIKRMNFPAPSSR
jgi:tetratricopeptide (TPR) repeat protein